jgi:ring-1,2-phenylacetyl-CoA epoxidase subunit PaaE
MSMSRITVTFEGATHSFAMARGDRTIIEAADEAGVELPSQCRAGICSTCRGKLTLGEVYMRDSMALDASELAAGFVLACQSMPLTDEVAIEFDEP